MKNLTIALILCVFSIISYAQNNYIAQPYYGDNMIRFYEKTTGVLHHSLDIDPMVEATQLCSDFRRFNIYLDGCWSK
ncbi:MAG: hypothetical protein IPO14_10530 [Saprospiraceae bacterium]|nr:hypothetical protein [Saprospiraceae bacterium]